MGATRSVRTGIVGAAALLLTLTLVITAAPAQAGRTTVRDERGPAAQGPSNSLVAGTLVYTRKRTVFRGRFVRVRKHQTRMLGSVAYPDGSSVRVRTLHRSGRKVVRGTFRTPTGHTRPVPRRALSAQWKVPRRVVRIVIDHRRWDPKPRNRRAQLALFAVQKGRMHAPLCPFRPDGTLTRCNDDSVHATLRR